MLDGNSGAIQPPDRSIPADVIDEIKSFLHGAVHYWYKSHAVGDTFCFNDFMKDAVDDCWKYTPLFQLYTHYNANVPAPPPGAVNPAMKEAAKTGGLLLKSVLLEEGRAFKTVPSSSPNRYVKV